MHIHGSQKATHGGPANLFNFSPEAEPSRSGSGTVLHCWLRFYPASMLPARPSHRPRGRR
eukprot:322929-Prymnesium_polylepis.1